MNVIPLTAKEYLSKAHWIDQRITTKLEQVHTLRARATNITMVLSDMPVIHTPDTHPMESTIVRIVDLEREINADIDQLVDLKRELYVILRGVANPEYQLLLELRYLLFKSWQDIATALEMELRQVFRVHNQALEEVEKILSSPVVKDIVCHSVPMR